VHLGKWSAEVKTQTQATPVAPPGAFISAFSPDLTLAAWLYAIPAQTPAPWQTAATLYKVAPPPGNAETLGSGWEIMFECKAEPGSGLARKEAITLYLGPTASPRTVVRIDTSGEVHTMTDGRILPDAIGTVKIIRRADGWAFRWPIPQEAIEAGKMIRIGAIREDALGRRWAWPRPMLPWQRFPARRAFDIGHWNQL
jgi:hypothetical protein